jgi:hypothetical protein
MNFNEDQAPDPQPGFYYVTCRRDDGRSARVAGPYIDNHAGALADVARVKTIAEEHDARAIWYSWGTARCDVDMGPGPIAAATGGVS